MTKEMAGKRTEIDLILDHTLKNSLCAFNLQAQLMQFYLREDYSDQTIERLLEITSKTNLQVYKINESIERLRLLLR